MTDCVCLFPEADAEEQESRHDLPFSGEEEEEDDEDEEESKGGDDDNEEDYYYNAHDGDIHEFASHLVTRSFIAFPPLNMRTECAVHPLIQRVL